MIPRPVHVVTPDGVRIAYQVFGEGTSRLVYVPRAAQTIGYMWDVAPYARFLTRLGETAQVLALDVRGGGLSDRVLPSDGTLALEARISDIVATLDDVGWDRASLLGVEDGASLCAGFAATFPSRVERLILYGAYARGTPDVDYQLGTSSEEWEAFLEIVRSKEFTWDWWLGNVRELAPSHAGDEEFCRRLLYLYSVSATNPEVWEIQRDLDIRAILPSIQSPTLVLDRADNTVVDPAQGTYLAERIAGARRVLLPGDDFEIFAGDQDLLLDEIAEFMTGTRPSRETDRVLSTVLFTDIVGSTARAAEIGDAAWHDLLAHHDEITRRCVTRFRGEFVKHTGDGVLATFDGPARGVSCALAIADGIRPLGIEIRAGLHTGEIERRDGDIAGLAAHIGARVAAAASASEVLVSRTVKDLTSGSGLAFEDAGEHELKGVPDTWRLYRVVTP